MDKDKKNPNIFKINLLGFEFYLLNIPTLTACSYKHDIGK